jgi:hypothetical protein
MNTITYTLNPKSLVVKAYESSKVARSMGNGVAFFTNADELIADPNVTSKLLVNAYNEIADKPVNKFSDSKTAAKRFMSAIADIHVSSTPFDASKKTPQVEALPGMTPLGKTPHGTTIRPSTKARGAFAGKKIKCLIDTNPRKEGTRGWNNFSLFLGHGTISYEEFVELAAGHGSTKGGCREDLAHDIKKGRVELIDA